MSLNKIVVSALFILSPALATAAQESQQPQSKSLFTLHPIARESAIALCYYGALSSAYIAYEVENIFGKIVDGYAALPMLYTAYTMNHPDKPLPLPKTPPFTKALLGLLSITVVCSYCLHSNMHMHK